MKVLITLTIIIAFITACEHEPVKPKAANAGTIQVDEPGNPCDPNQVYFEKDILPILVSNCAFSGCHDAGTAKKNVILTSYQNLSNSQVVTPGDLGNSDLYERITETDLNKRMPLGRPALSNDQVMKIQNWILAGALDNSCDEISCDTSTVSYAIHIQPIIENSCVGCHRPQSLGGGIDLSTYTGVKAEANTMRLLKVITYAPGFKKMPLGGNQLPGCEINKIRAWINAGSPNN